MRPRLLDLFCGAGGAAMGYYRAGFDVVGVDIKPQPRYPFEFHQIDVLTLKQDSQEGCWHDPARVLAGDRGCLGRFDAIHASPPCQAHTALRTMPNAKQHADLVPGTRALLLASGLPWVIENVVGAPLSAHVMLCGTMFDLGTGEAELRRHRLFECHGFYLLTPPCKHYARQKVVGVYGGGGKDNRRTRPATVGVYGDGNGRDYRRAPVVGVWGHAGGKSVRDGTQQFSTNERREAMGIEWMNGNELSQAIPPAYTEFIGAALLRAVGARPPSSPRRGE